MPELSEETVHIRDYWRIVRKRQRLIFAIVFVVVVAVGIYSIRQTPVYQATARILIEKEAPKVVSFEEVVESSADKEYYETQAQILTSRPVIQTVIRKLGLANASPQASAESLEALPVSFSEQMRQAWRFVSSQIERWLGAPQEELVTEELLDADAENELIRQFLEHVTIRPVRGSRLLDVQARSTKKKQAAQIANALVKTYIEHYLETKTQTSRDAVSWLVKEVEDARQKLQDSEAALQQYKEQYQILSFEDRQNIVTQKLSELTSALNQARIKRLEVEAQYRQLLNFQHGELESIPEIIHDDLVRQLKLKLLTLESERTEVLKKFRGQHPNVIALESQISAVREQLSAQIHQVVSSIKNTYDLAKLQEQELSVALEGQKAEAQDLNQKSIQYSVLAREVESNQRMYETLLQRAKETSLTERLETSNVRIVELASIPSIPVFPKKTRNVLLAGIVGLIAGLSLAFFLEYLDQTFHTPDEVKHILDIPFLGIIPKITPKEVLAHEGEAINNAIIATITVLDARSTMAEAYRSLRTNVVFSLLERKVVLITSSTPAEGKSSVTANLGIALAQSGRRTLIIDADLRRPMMNTIFNVEQRDYEFASLLVKYVSNNGHNIENVIYQTGVENLFLLPCLSTPPNPSELLGQEKTAHILQHLQRAYDIILIDSPPINAVTDPIILSRLVDGVILVIQAGKTPRDAVLNAREQLKERDATILGGVLNAVDVKRDHYYYHYYGYKYHKNYYAAEKK